MKISHLLDKEFKIMVTNMHTELRRGMDEHNEDFKKETENTKRTNLS